jgi:hypothetical protein
MNAVEFITELTGASVLAIPSEIAAQLPEAGHARVIVLFGESAEDAEWQSASYDQFLREDRIIL